MEALLPVAFRDISYPCSVANDQERTGSADSYKFRSKQWKPYPVPSKLRHSRNFGKGENKTVTNNPSKKEKSKEELIREQ